MTHAMSHEANPLADLLGSAVAQTESTSVSDLPVPSCTTTAATTVTTAATVAAQPHSLSSLQLHKQKAPTTMAAEDAITLDLDFDPSPPVAAAAPPEPTEEVAAADDDDELDEEPISLDIVGSAATTAKDDFDDEFDDDDAAVALPVVPPNRHLGRRGASRASSRGGDGSSE